MSGTHDHTHDEAENTGTETIVAETGATGGAEHGDGVHDHAVTFDPSVFDPTLYASVDHLAGTVAANGKPIWSAEQAATYLFRAGAGYGTGLNMVMPTGGDVNVLTYGFHTSQASLQANGYVYRASPTATGLSGLSEYFAFRAFTDAQKAATREAFQYWDDVVSTEFVESHIDQADVALANYTNQPGTQAYARLLANTVTSNPYINAQIRDIGGDVWVNFNAASNFQLDEGGYGMNTLVHEIGHGFGMLHPGDYNATVGGPVLSYTAHAEYYQDTRSYSILSYWDPRSVGARDFDFSTMNIAYGATPMVHDILAMQLKYGAEMTTRTGDTVYGFNSTAGRDAFDFVKTPAPMMAIWDAGGIDTLDASGYKTNQVINLSPGSLSSIGGITADEFPSFEQVNANRAAAGMAPTTLANYTNNRNLFMTNPGVYGRITDNVGIAYGAIIENAVGGSGHDSMIGNVADNVMTGNAGNDLIASGLGNDTLDGGTGNDEMLGGAGNDSYVVGEAGDIVTELADEGTDTVRASIDYTLGANVENLVLTGAALNGAGNGLANAVTGNALANLLSGGAGDDTLDGGTGADAMAGGTGNDAYVVGEAGDTVTELEGEGTDTVRASIDYTLGANLETLVLTGAALKGTGNGLANAITGNELANLLSGGAGDDMLAGGAGDDMLDGGTGADAMAGGTGNDVYVVDHAGDTVVELGGEGTDTVSTDLGGYTLGAHVENLILTGSAAAANGNDLDNVLTGNALSNRLNGGAGADRLIGGDGVDFLTGGAGADVFVGELNATRTASKLGNVSLDVVLDFASGSDKIDLSGIDAITGVAGDQAFKLVKSANPSNAGEISIRNFGNVNAAEAALGFDIDGVDGKSPYDGPVQVVLGNVDGGAVDFAMVFIGTPEILTTDFVY
ncbi:MAG TPA: M10 family metallopeptidase C-terminal domain-containing protein [Allosphingosinicella sp.]|jgi:serralysin